jgi:hypothetical protein
MNIHPIMNHMPSPPPAPGHSFRPHTEKELPFPVPDEKCFYTPISDLMSTFFVVFSFAEILTF